VDVHIGQRPVMAIGNQPSLVWLQQAMGRVHNDIAVPVTPDLPEVAVVIWRQAVLPDGLLQKWFVNMGLRLAGQVRGEEYDQR